MNLNRRTFLKTTTAVGGGLMIGGYFRRVLDREHAELLAAGSFEPNIWLKVNSDDTVRIMLTQLEMGQGVMTSMPMLVAEELDMDWSKIKTEWTPADAKYGNPNFGGQQLTAGSNSVRGMWKILRGAGATARAMLVTAAAQTWNVPENSLTTEKGEVVHKASNRRAKYGALVDKAAALPVPKDVKLKDPKNFKLMGKDVPRLDIPEKVNGSAVFGMDVKLPGLLTARVARCPVFGGKVASFNARQGQGRPRREARRPDQQRRRRRRRQLLLGDEGPAGARGEVGRRQARDAVERRHPQAVRRACAEARQDRAQPGQRRQRVRQRAEEVRARLRSAVPRARDDGADELHGGCEAGQLRRVRADAGPDRVAHGRDRGVGPADGQGEDPHHVSRRRVRPPRRSRLRHRSRRDVEGRRRAGQGDLVARRRHAARLLPADQLRPHVGRGGRVGQAAGVHAAPRAAVADEAARIAAAERRRLHLDGRRRVAAVRHPEHQDRVHGAGSGHPVRLLAIGRRVVPGLRHRSVRRRAGRRGRQGSVSVPARSPEQGAASSGRAQSRGGEGRLGQAAAAGPRARHRGDGSVRQHPRAGH